MAEHADEKNVIMTQYLPKFINLLCDARKITKNKRVDPDVLKYLFEVQMQKEMEHVIEPVIVLLKEIVLLRQRDRSLRENSIKGLKILLKLNPKLSKIMRDKKIHVFISFILEREFKNNAVVKERI